MNAGKAGPLSGREPFRPAWALAGVALLVICLLFRSWTTFSQPGLHVEDAVLFSYYYGHGRPLTDIFASHIGQQYLTLTADFFAWLYAWADVHWQPWLYQWTGFVVAVSSVATVSFSGLVRNRMLLLVCPVFLGLTGLNHIYYYNTLIYVMYTGVLMLLVLLLYPPPKTVRACVFQAVLLIVLPWSGPYSVLVLPAVPFLFFCTNNRTKRALLVIAAVSTLIYFLTVSENTVRIAYLLRPWIIVRYLQTVFDKIFFFDFVQHLPMWYGYGVLLVMIGVLWFLRRDQEYLHKALVMLGFLFTSLLLFFLSVKFVLYRTTSDCHRLVASFFYAIFLVVTADRLFVPRFLGHSGPLVCAGLLLILVFFDNRSHREKGWVRPVPEIAEYIQTIHFYEQQGLVAKHQAICLRHPPVRPMQPRVLVGYRGADRRLLLAGDAEVVRGRRFVCHR